MGDPWEPLEKPWTGEVWWFPNGHTAAESARAARTALAVLTAVLNPIYHSSLPPNAGPDLQVPYKQGDDPFPISTKGVS